MHVAVAPACNIQCHYCNRKYDCANESRPGVVSELLTPEQAVKKTLAVAEKIPQLSVLGIAGPGDPLANPDRTFATFRMLAHHAPDIKLCVSTNGLALPDCVDELARHNIEHVTITINCLDPEVGRRIYPWVFWKHRRLRGREAAAALIERQQQGLEMLVERNILVKVNSVMIPGVNDQHLEGGQPDGQAKGGVSAQRDAPDRRGRARHLLRTDRPARADAGRVAGPPGPVRREHEHDAPLPAVPGRRGGTPGRGSRRRSSRSTSSRRLKSITPPRSRPGPPFTGQSGSGSKLAITRPAWASPGLPRARGR